MMLINMRQSSELPSGGSGVYYYSLPTLERDGILRRLVVEGPL